VVSSCILAASLIVSSIVQAAQDGRPGRARRSESQVKVDAVAAQPDAMGNQVVLVTLTIDSGWHVYANPVGKDPIGTPTTITIEGNPKPQAVQVDYPPGKLVKDEFAGDHYVYEGTVTIRANVRRVRGDKGPLQVAVRLQACTEKKCLLPATIKQTVR
jgi:DsbC/DsbD-like thiol-disulfide interchange protein